MRRPSLSTFIAKGLPGPSWRPWRSVIAAALGQRPEDGALVRQVTGRRSLPTKPVKELWCAVGRGGGKSRASITLGVGIGICRSFPHRAPGEPIFIGLFSPDRRQSQVDLGYAKGLLHSSPALESLIASEARESIELIGDVVIEVITATTAAPRGRSYAVVVIGEAAFLPTDQSAEPDRELLRAVRPALARVPNSLLVVVSSTYARKGELYRAVEHRNEQRDDVLVVVAPTTTMNPLFDAEAIQQALQDDPESARAEYFSEFRSDIETYLSPEAVAAVTVRGRYELPPVKGAYVAFVDPAGGSGADSMTLGIAAATDGRAIVVCLREVRPGFNPSTVVEEFAALLKTYAISRVTGDRYAAEWPREAFRKHGIDYVVSEHTKSDLYRELLPAINAGRVELLDHARANAQLTSLERRTGRSGRDSIDHPPGGHDDLANVIAGAVVYSKVGLGKPALPTEFTHCARAVNSGGAYNHHSCYLFGGLGGSVDGVDDCRRCPGDRAARSQWRRYVENGGEQDLRTWSKSNIRLPDALAWAELRAWVKTTNIW
jgi:hypothetical protein